ncbi:MAG: hypothetical protein ACLTYN_06250 [Dysosmobacter welbionis]
MVILGKGDRKYEFFSGQPAVFRPHGRAPGLQRGLSRGHLCRRGSVPDALKRSPAAGQMIAMRYGTVPIVRETGGLKDTVSVRVLEGRRQRLPLQITPAVICCM